MKGSLQKILMIYSHDLKNIATNWVAALLIGGIVFLPSLYAWFNIYASWDPYGQTNQMQVAIINEDEGTTVRGSKIAVGQELVEELATNKTFDWKFTNRTEAMGKVTTGDYFAAIIIPKDFSGNMASILQEHPQQAAIEYYVNEKINSIAPKITEKGASGIASQISSEFIATVSETILSVFNDLGIELENAMPNFEQFENYVFLIEEKLPEIEQSISKATADSKKAADLVTTGLGKMPEVQQATSKGIETVQNALIVLGEAQETIKQFSPVIEKDLAAVQKVAQEVEKLLNQVGDINVDQNAWQDKIAQLEKHVATTEKTLSDMTAYAETIGQISENATTMQASIKGQLEKALNEIRNHVPPTPEEQLAQNKTIEALQQILNQVESLPVATEKNNQLIAKLTEFKGIMGNMSTGLNALKNIDLNDTTLKEKIKNIQQLAASTNGQIDRFLSDYKNEYEPKIQAMLVKANESLLGAKRILTDVQGLLPKMTQILKNTNEALQTANATLAKFQNDFPVMSNKIHELANKLRSIQEEADLNEIIDLLKNNTAAERDFLADPVKVEQHKLFPIENYGTGMMPFYTVLSIWVGCLLLISLLSVTIHHGGDYSIREVYFGRLLTFGTFSFFQSLIITIGDLVLFEGSLASPALFVLFGVFISAVFITIVYTFVSVFGDVGKAMAIVMLVLQIAGSGGTYPVQLLPGFFKAINPFLPFTYAIELMREAVGGIVQATVLTDITVLLALWIAALLFGVFFKKILSEKTEALLKKARETDIIH